MDLFNREQILILLIINHLNYIKVMKKVIELALKSGEITLQGVMNLVNCIDIEQQERAVMLLTENDSVPDGITILHKGVELNKDGEAYCNYTCIGYNYLQDKVVVKKQYVGENEREFTSAVSVSAWKIYRENYIEQQQKEREEYLKKQQEQQ